MNEDEALPARATDLIGTWRRFGPTGPVYRVTGQAQDPMKVEVRVLETGEELAYDTKKAMLDPRED